VDGVLANSYIVLYGDPTLIDSGMPNNGRRIIKYANNLHAQLKYILLTHAHIDHVGSAHYLKEKANAKVAIHEADAPYLNGLKKFTMPKGFQGLLYRVLYPFISPKPFEPDIKLKDGDLINGFEVINIKGHTEGSCAFYHRETRSLFIGDSISMETGKPSLPPDRYNYDTELLKRSLKRLLDLDFENFFPGHGDPIIGGAGRIVKEFVYSF